MHLEVFMELVRCPDLYTEVSNLTIMTLTPDTSTQSYTSLINIIYVHKNSAATKTHTV